MSRTYLLPASLSAALLFVSPPESPAQAQPSSPGSLIRQEREKTLLADFNAINLPLTGVTRPFTSDNLVWQVPAVRIWAQTKVEQSQNEALDKAIGKLFPNKWERWGRFQQLKIEAQEQPATILVYANPPSSVTVPILNPDHVLWKYSVAFKGAEFFPTTTDVGNQLKAFSSEKPLTNHIVSKTKVLCPSSDKKGSDHIGRCLLKDRRRDFWYRSLSGATGLFSYSDNPQVQQNILIPSGTPIAERNRLVSGQVDFDPSNIFLTGTDWKNGITSASYYDNDDVKESIRKAMYKRCKGRDILDTAAGKNQTHIPEDCIESLSGPRGWGKFVASIVPQVEYKISTQFDFIKSGQNFVQPPYPLGHLYYFSFTQDLRRTIASSQARVDALAAIHEANKPPPEPPTPPLDANKKKVAEEFSRMAANPSLLDDAEWFKQFCDRISVVLMTQKTPNIGN